MKRLLLSFAILLLSAVATIADEGNGASLRLRPDVKTPAGQGTILPPENPPDFVKRQWEDVVANGQFPLPKRDWQAVGLPPGLEEQVWKAWAPGAKQVWRNISPGYNNVIYDAKVDNGVISFLLDGFGLIQSKDGGKSWRPVSHHLTCVLGGIGYYSFDISPKNPEIIAIAGATLDRTLNGGRSWGPVVDQALPPFKPVVDTKETSKEGGVAFGFVRFNADGSRVFAGHGAFGHTYVPRGSLEKEMARWLKRKLIYVGDGEVANFKAIDLGGFAAIRFILPHFSNPDLVYASFSDGSIYVCRNARAETPVFTELAKPKLFDGLQAVWMDVSPEDPSRLLVTLSYQGTPKDGYSMWKLVLAKVSGDSLECSEIDPYNFGGKRYSLGSARWNPRNPSQVYAGAKYETTGFCVSDDGMKSFHWLEFPQEFFPLEHNDHKGLRGFAFDRKSDLSVVYSELGSWSSRDDFKNVEELLMTTDDNDKKLHGNKGVGFAECGEVVCIRDNYTYLAITDHGAWRSNGKDTSMWRKISDNPGMPETDKYRLAQPMAVSNDEQIIYLVSRVKNWSQKEHKLVISKDKGDSWQDITSRLGLGDVVEGGIQRIFFDPTDAKTAWVMADEKLFLTTDGGESFKATGVKLSRHLPIAYDPVHKTLYAPKGRSKVARSLDMGFTWTELPIPFNGTVFGLDVLGNGDLVASDDGRLMVIPYGKIDSGKIEQSMIRMTLGDNIPSAACGQRTFRSITCRGTDILAFTFNGWNDSNAARHLGPLLSRDGGKTFKWIVYDMPCPDPAQGSDMRDGRIIIGNRGIYELDLNSVKLE